MKTKHLLLTVVMIVFTALTVVAQHATNNTVSKTDAVPFGKELLPAEYTGRLLHYGMHSNINPLLISDKDHRDINSIKKRIEDYRKRLREQNLPYPKNRMNTGKKNANAVDADFHLTKDINAFTASNPTNFFDVNENTSYAILNNVIYFAADDGIHGIELWRSDGTAAGTFMVADIEPGAGSSEPYNITSVNGKIYFSAITAAYGREPWVSDGTASGTQLLMDIKPGDVWSWANEFIGVGDDTYFVTDSELSSWGALWKTDGTTAGTKLVKSIGDIDAGGAYIIQPVELNGILYFTFLSYSSGSWELWRSDGTGEGTYHIGNNAFFVDELFYLTKYNNKLYFTPDDGTGRKLWVSDGTDAGTMPAPGNNNVLISIDYALGAGFPVMDNVLYLTGDSSLYKYDASNNKGVVLVKDVASSPEFAYVSSAEMEVVNNTLYFRVVNFDGGYHFELWNTKGTKASTQVIDKSRAGESLYNLYNGNGNLYFVKSNKLFGTELWKISDTRFGRFPILVSDILRGEASSYPYFLTALNGKLFFSATNNIKGRELFMTKGFGAALVKDINTASSADSWAGYYTNTNAPLDDNLIFMAFDNAHGDELYASDGTEQGTLLLKDIFPGGASATPFNFLSKNNAAYFIARNSDTAVSIYKTNGKKNGLQKVVPDHDYIQSFKIADNGLIFYVATNFSTFSSELWRCDGTAAGTFLLFSTLTPGHNLNVAGNTAFFVASDGDTEHGYELWKSDGSVNGTMLVKDINPGPNNSYPVGMFAYNNEVYFAADNGSNPSFWKSDGTEAGTIQLQNIDPWYSSVFSTERYWFHVLNNIIYFSAVDVTDTKGTQLWKTDGTVAGTQVVKDINPDATGYYPVPYYFRDVNGSLFFIEYLGSGITGSKLWKTDGTDAGTQLVKDISEEAGPGSLFNLTSFAGKLFFTYNGMLWSSDGTVEGTMAVDAAGLSDVYIYNIIAADNQLFLSGQNSKYGKELYAGTINETGKFVASKTSNAAAVKTAADFNAVLYPNPVVSNTTLQITGNAKNVSISITDMSGKKLWQSSNSNATLIKLPIEKYTSGTYIVTVTNGTESKTIKLIKQ